MRAGNVASGDVEGVFTAVASRGIRFVACEAQYIADLFPTHGISRSEQFRIVKFVFVVIARDSPPAQAHAAGLGRCMTVFIALVSHGKIKVAVVARHLRCVAAFFDGVFNQIGRSNDVFMVVEIHVTDGKHVRDEHHFVVRNAFGNVVVALDYIQAPGFIFVCNGVIAGRTEVAVFIQEFCCNFHGFASRVSTFGHDAAKQEPDAPFFQA